MTKVNGNGGDKTNLEALKSYYEALNAKKAGKEEKTAAGCSIRAVLWHKSVGSTDSRSGRACNKLRMRLAIMIYLGR